MFTHTMTAFVNRIKSRPGEDKDTKDLLDLARYYADRVLEPYLRGFGKNQSMTPETEPLKSFIKLFDDQLTELDGNIPAIGGNDKEVGLDSKTISACPPLELLIRCIWPEGESFFNASKLLSAS